MTSPAPVVVITGASSGIGAAIARELARHGCRLVLAARRAERLAAVKRSLPQPDNIVTVSTDVTDAAQLERLVQSALAAFGRIDVWVNNAGIGIQAPWWEQDAAAIRQTVDTNLSAVILATRAALPTMLQQGSGHFIQIGSVAGLVGTFSVYSATKFGVSGFSAGLRREVGNRGIRVSLVAPGFIRTEMTSWLNLRLPGPEVVARAVVRVMRRPRRLVIVPGWYRLAVWLERLVPGWLDRMYWRFFQGQRAQYAHRGGKSA